MKETIIVGVSGKKQSGKTTLCEYLKHEYISHSKRAFPSIDPIVKLYSFADTLKEKVCMDVLGLTYAQCYETDEDKNTLTDYSWDRMPDVIRYRNAIEKEMVRKADCDNVYEPIPILRQGKMRAREIMQIVGTDIFRKYFDDDVWVNATFRLIEKDKPIVAIISDVRFPGEVDEVIEKGGDVIRLLRDVCEKDPHKSESALDKYDFETHRGKVFLLDNQDMSIDEKNNCAMKYIAKISFTKHLVNLRERIDKEDV